MMRLSRAFFLLALPGDFGAFANARDVTVSGQSAGGSMAMQHLFAFSGQVQGAGIAAGSPYGCGAFRKGHGYSSTCYYGGTDVPKTINYIQNHFKNGLIDDPANLKSTPVVVFNGKNDWEVYTRTSRDIVKQLRQYVSEDHLEGNFDTAASHVWSLDNGQCSCGACSWYWAKHPCCDVNNCRYDLSGDILRRAYGPLKPRAVARQSYMWIPQHQYLPPKSSSWTDARVEEWAILYVPTKCRENSATCRVHINYHGCIANKWPARRMWVGNLDLNEYGEANDIIILYPQAQGDRVTGKGCWNWGFKEDDRLFDTKESVQLKMVMNMVDDLDQIIKRAVELPLDIGPPAKNYTSLENGIVV